MWDYGEVPTRHFVIYTPLMAFLLSTFPPGAALLAGRILSASAWFGLLGWLALSAEEGRRRAACVAAIFVGGVYVLALFGGAARPDSLAVLLAGVAFCRSVRRGRAGLVDGALFALACWVQPDVFTLCAGALP